MTAHREGSERSKRPDWDTRPIECRGCSKPFDGRPRLHPYCIDCVVEVMTKHERGATHVA